tara:strand:+ start:373 stop:609 length:237 start_codon:yes stop_codon:yes gene_type:complete
LNKESWYKIDMEELYRWLINENIMMLTKEDDKNYFILTPKGLFLMKVLNDAEGGKYTDKEFGKLLAKFDWSFLQGKRK